MSHLAPAQPEPDEEETRGHVLSLQSSVVYGCVGNKASVFPLQLLGFEADPVHSCQFSNHTGYKVCTGSKMMGEELAKVVSGLKQNNFLQEYTDLLTGYMASASFLQETARLARSMRESNPNLFYVCDPVLGDDLRLYVPEEFVEIYRDEVVPLANVVTPNQTEAQYLTGQPITSLADAALACEWFHERGVPIVVITSITLDRPDVIHILASHRKGLARNADFEHASSSVNQQESKSPLTTTSNPDQDSKDKAKEQEKDKEQDDDHHVYYHLSIPRVPRYYSGTGDLTAALLLAWLKRDRCLKTALEKSIASVQAVLARTQKFDRKEIMIVPSRHDIDHPRVALFATPLSIEQLRAKAKEAEAAKAEAAGEANGEAVAGHVHCVPDC